MAAPPSRAPISLGGGMVSPEWLSWFSDLPTEDTAAGSSEALTGDVTKAAGSTVTTLASIPATVQERIVRLGTLEIPVRLGAGSSLIAGHVIVDSSGLYISPVAASGGGAFANENTVRWTTDATYRTAIWRSDDTSLAAYRRFYIDHVMSSATLIAQTRITTTQHGLSSTWGTGALQLRCNDTAGEVKLWADQWLGASGGGYGQAFLSMWNNSAGPNDRTIYLGMGSVLPDSASLGSISLTSGIGITTSGVTVTGTLSTSSSISERGRSTAMGAWTPVAHNAANFTANGATWTVSSTDQLRFAYALVGTTMIVLFEVIDTDVSAVTTELRIAIPGGFTSAGRARNTIVVRNAGGSTHTNGQAHVTAGAAFIVCQDLSANWGIAAGNTSVIGTLIFEVS